MKHGYWLWLLLLVLLVPVLAQESSTETPPPTETASATVVPTIEPSPIPTATVEPIPTTTELPSASPTEMPSVTPAPTETSTVTLTLTDTPGVTPTASETLLGPETTETVEITPTETASPAETETATLTMTLSETPEATATSSATATATTVPMQPVFVETFESAYPNSWVRGPNSDVVFTLNPSNGSLLVTNDVVYPRELSLANTRLTFQFKLWSGALSAGLRTSSMGMYRVAVDAGELRVYRNEVLVATAVHTMNLVNWALMSIELVDGRMLVTLNHMPMLEWTDADPLPGGEIQFAAWADLTGSVSSFQIDNVLIESDFIPLPAAVAAFAFSSSYEPLPFSDAEYLIVTEIYNERSVIVARSLDGYDRYLLSDPMHNSGKPRVSPDGEWLAFLSDRNGGNNLYVMRLDGTGLKQLTSSVGIDDMRWSPDSTQIVYRPSFWNGYVPTRLVIIDLATEQEQVVNIEVDSTLWNYSYSIVKWSPNGQYITTAIDQTSAYTPPWGTGGYYIRELWMVRLNLSDNTQTSLTYGGDGGDAYTGNNKGFAWLPDSSGYYFTRQENEDLWTMDIDGNWLSQLTNTTFTPCPNSGALDAAEIDPILSYDGTRVIYVKRTIACTPPYQVTDNYWQMNADGDLHDSLGISYADVVIHGLHDLVWPETNASSSLTLTLDVDAERLPADHPVDDLYTFRIGETIPLLAQIGAVGTQNINETIRIELMVPRELRPQGMQIQGEDPITLSDLIGILICLLTGGTDCGDLLNGILEIVLAPETVTYIYDLEGGVVVGQEFPITLDVVGEVVGTFVIEGTAYVLDASGTGQAMMLSGPESGMLQDSSGGTGGVNSTLGITVAQGGTPTPTNQIDLIAVFPGISNELMDMQAAANNEGLIVHDGPTWNAMKLTIPDGSPWIIPWGSVITVDRQITLPNNEIWVRLAQADGTNDAWVNLRNGQNGEYTYYTSTGSLDGIPELGGMEIITFTYDRRAAAEYAIVHSYNNNTTARIANRVTERITDFLSYAEFLYSELNPNNPDVEATGSAQFISEILWMGGMAMTTGNDQNCLLVWNNPVNYGWRYCKDVSTSSKAWSIHKGIGIHFTTGIFSIPSGGSSDILASNGTQLGYQIIFDGLELADRISPVEDWRDSGIFRNLTLGGPQVGDNPGGLNKDAMGTFAAQHLAELEAGDYVWINPYVGEGRTPHGLIVVGWQVANFCRDVLSDNTNQRFIPESLYSTRDLSAQFVSNPVPYVADYTTAQSPMPRPFYCTLYDQTSDPNASTPPGQGSVLRFNEHWFHFYRMPNQIRLSAQQLFTNTNWVWGAP